MKKPRSITFTVDCPACLKNNLEIQSGRGKRARTGQAALRAMKSIREAAERAIGDRRLWSHTDPLWGKQDIRAQFLYCTESETLTVTLWPAGDPPPEHTGRHRDLQNMQDVVFDALQKMVYAEDNQVVGFTMEKCYPKE